MKLFVLKIEIVAALFFLFLNPMKAQTAASAPTETLFIKTGGGMIFFYSANSPDITINSIKASLFTASIGMGVNCPDHFSFFASGELFPRDWSVIANAQYTVLGINFMKPYLFGGLGLALSTENPPLGLGVQLGIGTEFTLTKSCDLYLEGKTFGAFNLFPTQGGQWVDQYSPVCLTGLKFTL